MISSPMFENSLTISLKEYLNHIALNTKNWNLTSNISDGIIYSVSSYDESLQATF